MAVSTEPGVDPAHNTLYMSIVRFDVLVGAGKAHLVWCGGAHPVDFDSERRSCFDKLIPDGASVKLTRLPGDDGDGINFHWLRRKL